MPDAQILFVRPKAVSRSDKAALANAGVIVVEVETPHDVKFVRAGYEIESSAVLRAAMQAISKADFSDVSEKFTKALCSAIEAEFATSHNRKDGRE